MMDGTPAPSRGDAFNGEDGPAMKVVIFDRDEQRRLIRQRRLSGADRFDEVWNGVYVMSPLADNEHQALATRFCSAIDQALGWSDAIKTFQGVNVTDQQEKWKKNYRCPDIAVFLAGNPAEDRGSHWYGGPDFAVEVVSPYDRSRKKYPFYAGVGVRELLLVDRKPWRLELYRLRAGELELVGVSDADRSDVLASAVLPLSFRLLPGDPRPRIEVRKVDDDRRWLI
jgi:Uma2 family endonuclease